VCIRDDYNKTADVSATQLTTACGIIVLWLAAFLLFYLTVFDHDIQNVCDYTLEEAANLQEINSEY